MNTQDTDIFGQVWGTLSDWGGRWLDYELWDGDPQSYNGVQTYPYIPSYVEQLPPSAQAVEPGFRIGNNTETWGIGLALLALVAVAVYAGRK